MDQHEEIEAVEPEASAEQVDPRDEKIANLEAQLAEAQTRERGRHFARKSRNGKPASS
ncbi:heat shock protein [Escherichia coli]|uniref:Heat shock protein n=1 Tax=Escherichia coli TaxID=562 RepID=A0A376W6U2_ECOLX|nr:heat shock protein [Escherichia coli]